MKKSFLVSFIITLCLAFIPKVFAFDNYLLHTDKPVVKIISSDSSIITANVLVTVMNEKDTVIITPKQVGKAVLTFCFKDETIVIPVKVKKMRTIFKKNPKLNFIKIDTPPQLFQIDLPPRAGEMN